VEAEKRISDLENELSSLRKELTKARQPLQALEKPRESLSELREKTIKPVERKSEMTLPKTGLRLGERVRIRSLGLDGVICGVSSEDVEVQVGSMRLRTRQDEIERRSSAPVVEKPVEPPSRSFSGTGSTMAPSPGMEIDLRGQRAEDALIAMERYIESAYLAGMPFVRIIHGKGTGKLRQVLRDALRASPHVTRWEDGLRNEGGEGVTVAHIQAD
jgi:DNA mismatch repair protein MutS2